MTDWETHTFSETSQKMPGSYGVPDYTVHTLTCSCGEFIRTWQEWSNRRKLIEQHKQQIILKKLHLKFIERAT